MRTATPATSHPSMPTGYIARTDDVFKASDYKISPIESENVLIEHPAVV